MYLTFPSREWKVLGSWKQGLQWLREHCRLHDPPAHLGHIPAPQWEGTPYSQPSPLPPPLLWVFRHEGNLRARAGRDQKGPSTCLNRIPRIQHEPPLLPLLTAFSHNELCEWTGTSPQLSLAGVMKY